MQKKMKQMAQKAWKAAKKMAKNAAKAAAKSAATQLAKDCLAKAKSFFGKAKRDKNGRYTK